ncbi:MAG: hypothetical protein HY059_09670 [Proteobacteria bacterium]|nr:hypothetical protein [Pseudomonadota bacterium]
MSGRRRSWRRRARARALRSIQRFREEGGALVDEHDNAAIFGKVFQAPWASYAPERLDAEARAIADPYVLTNFLRVVYRPDSWRHLNVRDVLVSSLTGPRWELRDGPKAATVREQLEHGAASSNPAWTLFARLAASGLSDAELVDQYFRARYGVPPGDPAFLEDDKALRQAIASDAQAALR